MGIKDFLPNYFGGDTFYFGFNSFAFSSEHIVFDAAGLLFACAMRYTDSYIAADYTPSLLAFQRQLVYLNNTLQCGPLETICLEFVVNNFKEVSSSRQNLGALSKELLEEIIEKLGASL
mmetsp:Transcript_2051/g.2865  ORF Transcript_2051/g.2865 Transcript_2051/m.2865 type:complete len:119 (+) Transcript_2051:27-383(+)